MATYGKKLLDSEGNIILPKTRSSLVYMDDNSTVEDKISSILSEITKIKDGSTGTNANKILGDDVVSKKSGHGAFFVYVPGQDIPNTKENSMAYYNALYAKYDYANREISTTYMPKSGGTFTGTVTANAVNKYNGYIFRNINVYSGASTVATNGLVCYRA